MLWLRVPVPTVFWISGGPEAFAVQLGSSFLLVKNRGFPGGAVVENLPANAGDTGLSPGLGGSHMPPSNWAREPQLLSLRVWSLCSATRGHDSERPAHRNEEWPPLAATRGSPRTEKKTKNEDPTQPNK